MLVDGAWRVVVCLQPFRAREGALGNEQMSSGARGLTKKGEVSIAASWGQKTIEIRLL